MRRGKIIAQLESELCTSKVALGDCKIPYEANEHPDFYEGYWKGRLFGLQQALTLLYGKELEQDK